jgi:putative ABC transport system permease protein
MLKRLKERYLHNLYIAFEAILVNKLKSSLTALGIIFGVAAVISMLAIGNGAQQEILDQIKLVGVNNIVITPIEVNSEKEGNDNSQKKAKFSKGLALEDALAIHEVVPSIKNVSPEIEIKSVVLNAGKYKNIKIFGVTDEYFKMFNINIDQGQCFNEMQLKNGLPVCVIGPEIKSKFFSTVNPLNQYLKCGTVWLKVIGVIEKKHYPVNGQEIKGINNTNLNVFVPIKTMLLRYENRNMITTAMLEVKEDGNEEKEKKTINFNQLDKITIQVSESELLKPSSEIIERLLLRRHSGVKDFEITVPELLLKQQQKTRDIFNIVLGSIAGISLLVGGIGIMNIMLASVLERFKEIGIRMAIGAKRRDIIFQFLAESVLICLSGGILGIILGFVLSKIISKFADILTIISPGSVFIAFFVSVTVGICFGYLPAKKAAQQDPIESLRN